MDPFELLGVPRAFETDVAAAEARHRELSRLSHPDRNAGAPPAQRREALDRMVRLNDAWKIVKDPIARATWLLRDAGRVIADGPAGQKLLPPGFLLQVMEDREELAEARADRDVARVHALAAKIRARRDGSHAALAAAFRSDKLDPAMAKLAELRYYDRFLQEVEAFEDEEFEARHG